MKYVAAQEHELNDSDEIKNTLKCERNLPPCTACTDALLVGVRVGGGVRVCVIVIETAEVAEIVRRGSVKDAVGVTDDDGDHVGVNDTERPSARWLRSRKRRRSRVPTDSVRELVSVEVRCPSRQGGRCRCLLLYVPLRVLEFVASTVHVCWLSVTLLVSCAETLSTLPVA